MTRKDVTQNTAKTFEELESQLESEGFNVDHFHAVEVVDGEEFVTHFNKFEEGWDNDRGFENTPQGWDRLVADEYHQ